MESISLQSPFSWLILLLPLLTFQSLALISESPSTSVSDCQNTCGGIEIPYPFGIGESKCFESAGFAVSCSQTQPQILYLNGTNLQIMNIFYNGTLSINAAPYVAHECINITTTSADYNSSTVISNSTTLISSSTGSTLTASSTGSTLISSSTGSIELPPGGPFTISPSNMFTAIGCDINGLIFSGDRMFRDVCPTTCHSNNTVWNSGIQQLRSCSGDGCCETAIPKSKQHLDFTTRSLYNSYNDSQYSNNSSPRDNMPSHSGCSYAFVAEGGRHYNFSSHDYLVNFRAPAYITVKLDWGIGSQRCSDHKVPVCRDNSTCFDSETGSGYFCNCSDGYHGNPYLDPGCKDIDECKYPQPYYPCDRHARCINQPGSYKCSCRFPRFGDGTKESGCKSVVPIIFIILGTISSFVVLLGFGSWLYWAIKKRRLIKLREQYFEQNGGLLLKMKVSSLESNGGTRIFSSNELEKATDNYSKSRILGTGGYGTVYKGVLADETEVAVKISKVIDQTQINQFINEVAILTQINHRNVVKLLGCCLETQVPVLVYEFISNGTLHAHIHDNESATRISWGNRLRIAIETAEALSYLHSAASMPIFHRDVKSANILLDEKFTTKVADFGISRLVSLDQTKITTLVQGTLGYLDPEYFLTSQLTAKSDVYSFGVVLAELLTGQKPVSFERTGENSNLAKYFVSSLKRKVLNEILDEIISREGRMDEFEAVAEVARKCLLMRGEERPTMKEVARELGFITGCSGTHAWVANEGEEEALIDIQL